MKFPEDFFFGGGGVGFCVKKKAGKNEGVGLAMGGNYMGVSANVPTLFLEDNTSIWEIFWPP